MTAERDFQGREERVWSGDRRLLVVRQVVEAGAHVYSAYERVGTGAYSVVAEFAEGVFGRVDTLRSAPCFDPVHEYAEAVAWLLKQQGRAHKIIAELCPETIHQHGEAVYNGPGYITLLTRPEPRFSAFMAARRPF